MPICEKCGSDNWEVIPLVGALETFKCKICGTEELVHTHYIPKFDNTSNMPTTFYLSIKLPSKINSNQMKLLRTMFNKVESMTPLEIKELSLTGQQIDLVYFPAYQEDIFSKQLKDIGVTAIFSKAKT